MPSVIDLVEGPAIDRLAAPVDRDLGRALARDGAVHLTLAGPLTVAARVDGAPAVTATLIAAGVGLRYSCTCASGRAGVFCAHLVATARVAGERAAAPD
jgi:uncharacterized Zn finger protein